MQVQFIKIQIFLCLLLAPIISFSEQAEKCLNLGETSSVGGVPRGEWKLDPPCCSGLTDRETIVVCGSEYGGGYAYICLKCGDNNCDHKLENTCNCPEDCSDNNLNK